MSKVPFASLPFIVRLSAMLTLLVAWVCTEEFVIEPAGLDRYMPLYRVGGFCVYDAAVIATIAILWIVLERRPRA